MVVGAVDGIAGAQLPRSGLQKILRGRRGLRRAAPRSTEKMLPTGAFTSMLLEPSSGSKASKYLPSGYSAGIGIGSLQLLGHHARQVPAILAGAQKDVVRR